MCYSSPTQIHLTRLAADVTAALLERFPHARLAYSFKAVMAVPVFEGTRPSPSSGAFKEWLEDFAGISARGRHYIIHHLHVARNPGLDLNVPPLFRGPDHLLLFCNAQRGKRQKADNG